MEKFYFTEDFQRKLVSLAVYSTDFLNSIRDRLRPDHFTSKEHWIIATLTYEYFDRYKQAPGSDILQEAAKYARRVGMNTDAAAMLTAALDLLDPDLSQTEYMASEINSYIRHEELRRVLEEFIPQYNRGEYDLETFGQSVQKVLNEYAAPDEEAPDVLSNIQQRAIQRYGKGRPSEIATLISPLDKYIVGIRPTQLGVILGPSGIGKTTFCAHLGKAGLLQGCLVLHYTLETPKNELDELYDRMLAATNVEGLSMPGATKKILSVAQRIAMFGGKLFTTYMTHPTLSMIRQDAAKKIEAYLKVAKKSVRVLIILDYLTLIRMAGSAGNLRYDQVLGVIMDGLKQQLAVELNAAVWVTHQTSRAGVGAERITELHSSDSYEPIRKADIALGFNRNVIYDQKKHQWMEQDMLHDSTVVRMFIIKNRGRSDKHDIRFGCDLDRSQFYSRVASDKIALHGSENTKKVKGNYAGVQANLD